MKKLLTLLVSIGFLQAGLMDAFNIKDAQNSYANSDYNTTIINYKKVEKIDDNIHYNLAEAYYKSKDYKNALKEYNAINSSNLEFKKQHNIGNTLAHLKKIDDAIKAYEKALEIKEDKDTRYNLELLKKMKKKQQQKQNKKDNKKNQKKKQEDKKQDKKKQDSKNKDNKKQKENKNNKDNKQKQQQNKEQQKKEQQKKENQKNKEKQKEQEKQKKSKDSKDKEKKKQKEKLSEALKKEKEQEKKRKMGQEGKPKKLPISDMELRKYNKRLEKRGIKTLLLPINTKGVKKDEKNINPW